MLVQSQMIQTAYSTKVCCLHATEGQLLQERLPELYLGQPMSSELWCTKGTLKWGSTRKQAGCLQDLAAPPLLCHQGPCIPLHSESVIRWAAQIKWFLSCLYSHSSIALRNNSWHLLRWLIHTNYQMVAWPLPECSLQPYFLIFYKMDGLRIFQIFKFCFLFA